MAGASGMGGDAKATFRCLWPCVVCGWLLRTVRAGRGSVRLARWHHRAQEWAHLTGAARPAGALCSSKRRWRSPGDRRHNKDDQ
jgi:hypothetical protein